MKNNIISAIIGAAGLAGFTATSFGQGEIIFDNYDSTPYYPIVYGAGTGALQGTFAQGNVSVELGYALGTHPDLPWYGGGFTFIPSSVTSVNPATPGYFQGPIVNIPGYVSGPVTFIILAWTTNGGTTFPNALYATTLTWVEPSIATLPSPAGVFTALPGEIVFEVPEPTTLALAGLGGLASLVAFRRKQS